MVIRNSFLLIIRSQDLTLIQDIPKELPILFLSGKEDPVGDFGKGVMRAAQSYQAAGLTKNTLCSFMKARGMKY